MNSRYLMFEAQQAHYYGLNPALALASVTSTPAKAAGMDHRVGTIAEGPLLICSHSFLQGLIFAAIQDMMLVRIHTHTFTPCLHTNLNLIMFVLLRRYRRLGLPSACIRGNSSTSLYRRHSSA